MIPELEDKVKDGGSINGIGGKQKTGDPVQCDVTFHSGWTQTHWMKPTFLPSQPDLVILGTDFMQKFGKTGFDWEKGRVKLGEQWVYCLLSEDKQPNYNINPELSTDEVSNVNNVVEEFKDVFASNPKAPREYKGPKHYIVSETNRVSFDKPRRVPEKWMGHINRQIDEMLENGIIEPSASPYNSNVIIVDKKDGDKRFVIDYRSLNKGTIKDSYPLPNIDELIDKCQGAKYFTQLDLAAGYWCVPIAEEDRHKTAFSVPRGKYQCLRMAFGLKNSGPTFQRNMDAIVKNAKKNMTKEQTQDGSGLDDYSDNLILFSRNLEDHVSMLKIVMNELRKMNMSLRVDKCEFGYTKIDFLGFVIDGVSVGPSEANIDKVKQFPKPKNKKEIQRFLGLANFNRRFIKNYSTLAKPLTSLVSEKVQFEWGAAQEEAFTVLKDKLGNVNNLYLPKWKETFHIQTDASGIAVGGMLYQVDKIGQICPISFHSQTLTKAETRWDVTDRELWAIISCLRKWRVYCCEGKVTFHTDHEPLKNIRNRKDPRNKIMRWLNELEAVEYEVKYIPGDLNGVADSLSRIVVKTDIKTERCDAEAEDHIYAELSKGGENDSSLKNAQDNDAWIKWTTSRIQNKKIISRGPYKNTKYLSVDSSGLLYKGRRIVVPPSFQDKIIQEYHCQSHPGPEITATQIRARFWWRSLSKQVDAFTKDCRTCIQAKSRPAKAEMMITDVPKPHEMISFDIGSMPKSPKGNCCFILCVDLCTKMINATALPNQTSKVLKEAFWEKHIAYYGVPQILVSDQGPNVDKSAIKELCDELGIEKRHSSPYHPQGNGSAERSIQTVKDRLRAMIIARQIPVTDWDTLLPEAVLEMNSQMNKSLKTSPFSCTFGKDARLAVDNFFQLPSITNELSQEEILVAANHNRDMAKKAYKVQHDKNASKESKEWKLGDRVLIKRTHGKYKKISPKWVDGPFHIVRKMSDVNWEITDSKGKHRIYHSNLMMDAGTRKEPVASRTSTDTAEVEQIYTPRHHEITIPSLPTTSTTQAPDPTPLISTTSPVENLVDQTLIDTLDMQRFREHVLSESPEAIEDCLRDPEDTINETEITTEESTETAEEVATAEVIPTSSNATRSGRVPKAVLGNRLIDQM